MFLLLLLAQDAPGSEKVQVPPTADQEGWVVHEAPPEFTGEGEDWGSFLGPRRDGTLAEEVAFGEGGPLLCWEVEVGTGYAQPVIARDRVIVHHRVENTSHVDCLALESGERLWRHSYPCDYEPRYIRDAGPRATPAIASGEVYVHSVQGNLMCLELASGKVKWERDLKEEFELLDGFFGVVSSPLVVGDTLYQIVGAPGPTVAAFDRMTGETRWQTEADWHSDCASPVMGQIGGKDYLFVITGGESRPPTGGLLILDPKTGEERFRYPFRSRTFESVNAACPLVTPSGLFISASYGVGAAGIVLGEEGFAEAWRDRRGLALQFSNPVVCQGRVMALEGKSSRAGELVQVDPATGEELARTPLVWEEETVYDGRKLTLDLSVGEGSLLVMGDDLICLGDQGHILHLRPSAEGAEILHRSWLFRAQESWTPPAISRGMMLVRQTAPEAFGEERAPRRVLAFSLR